MITVSIYISLSKNICALVKETISDIMHSYINIKM